MDVKFPNEDFNFDKIHIARPQKYGRGFFSKILYDESDADLYIQTPKCKTKNGVVKQNSKIYMDLMFNRNNNIFIEWCENLVEHVKSILLKNKSQWFVDSSITNEDIDDQFAPIVKTYKAVNYLLRVNIVSGRGSIRNDNYRIYNDSQVPKTLDAIKPDSEMISILEVQGIKYADNNFLLEFAVSQVMVYEVNNEICMIKTLEDNSNNNDKDIDNDNVDLDKKQLPLNKTADIDSNLEDIKPPTIQNNEDMINNTDNNSSTLEEITLEDKDKDINDNIQDITDTITVIGNDENGNTIEKTENIDINNDKKKDEVMTLKSHNDVHMELYKEAYKKAKEAKKNALEAYLRAKKIKQTYALEIVDESDDEDFQELLLK